MTSWQKIEEILHAALALDSGERAAFLDDACAGDQSMRSEIDSLLAYESRAGSFIESPALEVAATMLAFEEPEPAVTSVGPYQVLSQIGAGGMGEVYLALDQRLGRKIALKVLPVSFTQNADRVRRFEQEARSASALNHPNIITIFEIGQADGTHYIATEYIEGQTLRQLMRPGRTGLRQVLDIACQSASALAAAHEAGIVHRDIKPENIMLRSDGYIKVLDFGLAKLTETGATVVDEEAKTAVAVSTDTGVVMGTTSYMSPEQARGQKIDARTDLFSLGVVLYEVITRNSPFTGQTSADVLAAILTKEPPPLSSLAPEAPDTLDWVVAKLLRKDREERYQSARDLLSDLKSLKQRLEFEEELKRSTGGLGTGSGSGGRQTTLDPETPKSAISRQNSIGSLAVLPLHNTPGNPEMDYFSDGVTESIIQTLSRLPELQVMAWSTVSRYKDQQVDPREVGRNLGVRAVLTGRLIQLGENLVLKTELVNAADGTHLWGESCSCKPSDIFEVQSEICNEISEKLLVRLTTEERYQLTRRQTDNVEAYHAYLKGRYFWNKRTDESLRQGLACFKEAIDLDPCYALAYVGLADCYGVLGSFGIATMAPAEAFPKAREAAAKALEIDDTLAEAHASLGYTLANYYWDWPAAEREFERAFELKSDYATGHHWFGFVYLVAMGRLDEAVKAAQRAQEIDPLSLPISANVGFLMYLARRNDEAIAQFLKTLEMDQNFTYTIWELALANEQKGAYEEAISQLQKAISLSERSTLPTALLGHVYAVSGRTEEALATIDELKATAGQKYVSPYRLAAIYAALGETDLAFEWLELGYQERDAWMIWLNADPVMDLLNSDQRFSDLLERVGLAGVSRAGRPANPAGRAATRVLPAPRGRQSRRPIRSLAILPLSNTSDDRSMEYLSDGITESIINTLSQLPKIRVVPRSSVFRYKDRDADPQEVGRELGVEALLTGRVRQVGDRLIISAELVDIASDSQLWGEQYNRNVSDIFEVQEEIANEITKKLRLKLNPREKKQIVKRHTGHTEAYQLYLRGRYYWYEFTQESLDKARECFLKAIDVDPAYALAYAGLADTYSVLGGWEVVVMPPREAMPKAKAAAMKALELDEGLAEAHASLGYLRMYYDWDWAGAAREFERAIELNPQYVNAYHWYSHYLMVHGRVEESLRMSKKALELDPLTLEMNVHMAWHYYYAGEYEQVIEECRKLLNLEPNSFQARYCLGWAYERQGRYPEAIAEFQKAITPSGRRTAIRASLAHAYAISGQTTEARRILSDDLGPEQQYVSPYEIAIVYAGLGEKERALESLEKAYDDRSGWLVYLGIEPRLEGLRSDPRFGDLLRKVGVTISTKSGSHQLQVGTDQSISSAKPIGIAVLPFKPISAGQRDPYLELGIADALITRLSNLNRIAVRPTSAVRKYASQALDIRQAGNELQVECVLEGSIQHLGDRVRVTAQLVTIADGRSLWAGQFDEKFTDIFAVEDSISERVATALALKLTSQERDRLTKHYTENVRAYQAYLKGRYFWNKRTTQLLKKGVECFQDAIEADPDYALAYAGLADSYTLLVTWEALTPEEGFSKARSAARRALEIDGNLVEAHAGLAHTRLHTWDWGDAEEGFERALDLNPGYAATYQWYAEYLAAVGRFDQSIDAMRRAHQLDPMSVNITADVGRMLYFARRYDESIAQLLQAIEMEPGFWSPHHLLGQAYTQKGMHTEAIGEFEKALELSGKGALSSILIGYAYAMAGQRSKAVAIADELKELYTQRYFSPYRLAVIYAGLQDDKQLFEWLERAYDERDANLIWLKVDPALDGARPDPRFKDLIERIGIPMQP